MSRVPYSLTAIRSDDDSSGKNIVPYASVSVVDANGNPAQIYLQETGGIPSSYFALNENGFKQIWAEPGRYTITIDGGETYDIFLTGDLSDRVQSVATVADLATFTPVAGQVYYLKEYHAGTGYGGGHLVAKSGSITADGGVTFDSGSVGIYFERINTPIVTVLHYGARMGNDTLSVAQANTEAFRRACVSYKEAWDVFKLGLRSRSVLVPAGDYNLSNGFTLPSGCSIYGEGVGAARLKILNATADSVNKIPLISLQKVINDSGGLESTTGAYVTNPAPQVDDLYLNPQNTNTAIDIQGVPGFVLGRLWIQAQTAIDIGGGTSDGIIGELIIEHSTGVGLALGQCQNIMIDKLYTYVTNYAVKVYGYAQNVDVVNLQANYTRFSVVEVPDGISCGRINITNLVCNQNAQYGTFGGVLRLLGAFSDVTINHMDARNYNGAASVIRQGNSLTIGEAVLRQAPNNPAYTLGTTAGGFSNSNGKLHVDNIDAVGLATAPFVVSGSSGLLDLQVNGGVCSSIGGATVLDIASGTIGVVVLQNIVNRTGKPLFNPVATLNPVWRNIASPFPLESLGGRAAVRIPFSGYGNSWDVDIIANTNPGGSANYRRATKLFVCQESSFSASSQTVLSAVQMAASSIAPTYAPAITYQLDVGSVGAGASVAATNSGYAIVSVPSTYQNITITVKSNQ